MHRPHYWCHGELVGLQRGDMPLATEELAGIGFSTSFNRTVRTQILQFRIRPWCGQSLCGGDMKILISEQSFHIFKESYMSMLLKSTQTTQCLYFFVYLALYIHEHCSQRISRNNWGQRRFLNVSLAVRRSPGFVLWLIMAPGWLTSGITDKGYWFIPLSTLSVQLTPNQESPWFRAAAMIDRWDWRRKVTGALEVTVEL